MLTHYTKKIDSVTNILSHGFAWVANRRNLVDILIPHHDYSGREPQQFGMVSFTEATPEEARSHSDTFGRYGIVVSDEWAKRQNAQRVLYVISEGLITESLRTIFEIGYRDCEAHIRFPDDAGWTMAYENKAVTGAVVGAALWANLLQLYEYMESSQFSCEREWRIVHPDSYYSLAGRRPEQVIDDVSPPQGWAEHLNVAKIAPADVVALICPPQERQVFQRALPAQYANVPVTCTEG
jgi:hypothetical protein